MFRVIQTMLPPSGVRGVSVVAEHDSYRKARGIMKSLVDDAIENFQVHKLPDGFVSVVPLSCGGFAVQMHTPDGSVEYIRTYRVDGGTS